VATTLANVRNAVRFRIRDTAPGNRAIALPEMNEIIQANCRYLYGRIPLGEAWATAAVTVTAGSQYGTLVAGTEYTDFITVRRTSDGWTLTKLTPEEMDKKYWIDGTSSTRSTEEPDFYSVIESAVTSTATQPVTLKFQNYAKTTTTLDIYRRVMPSDLVADTSVITFSTLAVEALIDLSAVEAIAKLPEAVLVARELNPGVAALWANRAEKNIKAETERVARLRGVGRPLRFVP
jgi:hypothetical protein